jgi:hypothetical protein
VYSRAGMECRDDVNKVPHFMDEETETYNVIILAIFSWGFYLHDQFEGEKGKEMEEKFPLFGNLKA